MKVWACGGFLRRLSSVIGLVSINGCQTDYITEETFRVNGGILYLRTFKIGEPVLAPV